MNNIKQALICILAFSGLAHADCSSLRKYLLEQSVKHKQMILCKHGYLNAYQPEWKIPAYTIEDKTKQEIMTEAVKRTNSFREDTDIPEQYRSTLTDYKGSGYDRGHYVPAEDMDDNKDSMHDTFLLSNMAPEDPYANGVIINAIENYIRSQIIQNEEGIIWTGTIINAGHEPNTIGNHVVVPDYVFKAVYYPKKDYCDIFLIRNAKTRSDHIIDDHRVHYDVIEHMSDFKLKQCHGT